MSLCNSTDFLIIGGGVIALNIALSLKREFTDCSITIIEKEPALGLHASGRNSGVLHAGFYYTADSMKARLCKIGNKQLTEYCLEKNLPINRCGKLVVAATFDELQGLDELWNRAQVNGVELTQITAQEACDIEPRVRTFERALYSPTTATVSPPHIMQALHDDATAKGVIIQIDTAYISHQQNKITTSQGIIDAGYVINAAGLYADRIAMDYGMSQDYRILPFKGLYLYANENTFSVRTNIYPVPDLNKPFLGVHFTLDVQGKTKIGPTAIPALWREQYHGMDNFNLGEAAEIIQREIALFYADHFNFRQLAFEEIRKYSRTHLTKLAGVMLNDIQQASFQQWGKIGIRAQLVNIRNNTLEMDFKFEGDKYSFHILNAVSPAFTCSMPFSDNVVEKIKGILG
ncbi:MAG: L-2-hydroxyglutarate oxidase [Mariprofundales bacterium]